MNSETGEIKELSEIIKLPEKEQKKYIPIPDNEIEAVRGMNRAERRAWARKNKTCR